jgi:ABC-type multidrug transport system permease subunit
MHFLAISLRKDWARVRRDPSQLLVPLGIPLVLAVLMSMVFGRQPVTPRGRLLVDDEDQSIASARFLDGFRRAPLDKMVTIEPVTREAGRARIDRGEASAFLILPRGLQTAFLFHLPCQLELYTNPSERIIPQMIQETLTLTVDAAAFFRQGGQPLIAVENVALGVAKPARSFAAVFLPSSLFMGLLFIATSTAGDIWKERTAGTLRRIATSPVSMASYLAARLTFVALLYAIVGVLGLLAADRLAGMPVPNLPAAALWITFAGTVFYLLFLWISVQASTQRAAGVLANLIIFPLAMLGGCFFPFEWMPPWMVTVGKLTPNGWALSQFKAILDSAVNGPQLAICAALLTALGAVTFVLSWRRIARVFAV